MVAHILVIFFAMTPLNGTEEATQYTKMFIEYKSVMACEEAAGDLQTFKVTTPMGELSLSADCFPLG
jgi:hypothetical protein